MGMFNAKGIELDQITTSDPLTEGTNAGRGFAVSGGVAKAVKDLIQKEHPNRSKSSGCRRIKEL